MRRLLLAGLLLLPAGAAAIAPGETAPDFTLQDVNGAAYSLAGFGGKVVLLAFVGYG